MIDPNRNNSKFLVFCANFCLQSSLLSQGRGFQVADLKEIVSGTLTLQCCLWMSYEIFTWNIFISPKIRTSAKAAQTNPAIQVETFSAVGYFLLANVISVFYRLIEKHH